jgi:perosamine synthetase
MQPRLKLDIGWLDLASVWLPQRRSRAELEAKIASPLPRDFHPVIALSVRSLFDALLAETMRGRPVAISAVNVADMATLLRAHGCELRPIDIQLDDLLPSPQAAGGACGADAGMLLIAHLFGGRADIRPIVEACRNDNRLIVEDCAQAFDGRIALTPGADVALYSFGPIKVATALGGAVGLFHDRELAERVKLRMEQWPILRESWFLKRAAKFTLLKTASAPWIYALVLRAIRMSGRDAEQVIGGMARGFGSSRPIHEAVRHRPPTRLLRLLERRLRTWTAPKDASRDLLDSIREHAEVPGSARMDRRWWLAPVLVKNPDAIVAHLQGHGYDATRGATSMRAVASDGGPPPAQASRLIGEVVYLPKPADREGAAKLATAFEQAIRG